MPDFTDHYHPDCLSAALEQSVVIMPARGGSKRIPGKNIKTIHGQPMLYWPLKELLHLFKSKQIIVSTDNDDVKKVVKNCGLETPLLGQKTFQETTPAQWP